MWYRRKRNAWVRCRFKTPISFDSPWAAGQYRPPLLKMIDVRDFPATLDAINACLNAKNIAEVKREPKGIAVVEIKRQVKSIEKAD